MWMRIWDLKEEKKGRIRRRIVGVNSHKIHISFISILFLRIVAWYYKAINSTSHRNVCSSHFLPLFSFFLCLLFRLSTLHLYCVKAQLRVCAFVYNMCMPYTSHHLFVSFLIVASSRRMKGKFWEEIKEENKMKNRKIWGICDRDYDDFI